MKNVFNAMVASVLFVGVGSAFAASNSTAPTAATSTAYSAEQQSVLQASAAWQQAIEAHDPKAIAALYDPDAFFYPTFTKQITNPQDLYQYFVGLTKKTDLKVVYNQQNPRIFTDGVAANSGVYTFSYLNNSSNQQISIRARFSFIYAKENGQWMIVDHHSSAFPDS